MRNERHFRNTRASELLEAVKGAHLMATGRDVGGRGGYRQRVVALQQ
jgi:hypothetical protein